jgi:hypothetical protein
MASQIIFKHPIFFQQPASMSLSLLRSSLAEVVPANAGTHTPYRLF